MKRAIGSTVLGALLMLLLWAVAGARELTPPPTATPMPVSNIAFGFAPPASYYLATPTDTPAPTSTPHQWSMATAIDTIESAGPGAHGGYFFNDCGDLLYVNLVEGSPLWAMTPRDGMVLRRVHYSMAELQAYLDALLDDPRIDPKYAHIDKKENRIEVVFEHDDVPFAAMYEHATGPGMLHVSVPGTHMP